MSAPRHCPYLPCVNVYVETTSNRKTRGQLTFDVDMLIRENKQLKDEVNSLRKEVENWRYLENYTRNSIKCIEKEFDEFKKAIRLVINA